SAGLDTECDLAIEAPGEPERQAIGDIRNGLIAEHLGIEPHALVEAIERSGSLIGAIDVYRDRERGLLPFEAMTDNGPAYPIFGTRLLDPAKPFGLLHR